MRIIAESGATKTEWRALNDDGCVLKAHSSGLNPSCINDEGIRSVMSDVIPVLNPEGRSVSEIFFYGAGLVSEESAAPLAEAFQMWCPFAEMIFNSDLLAAARALFGDEDGVVAIMGTGSNSCLYSGGKIVENIRPGGFILGDEGGGAALGKAFVADYIKGLLPGEIDDDFKARYSLDYQTIVRRVYKEPDASAFLASFAPYILSRLDNDYVYGLVHANIVSFIERSLSRYPSSKVGVVGSFGNACRDILCETGKRYGLEFVRFVTSPIDELVRYHGI